MYSYGHQGGVWEYNKMHDNIQYGFDPHDDSDDLISEFPAPTVESVPPKGHTRSCMVLPRML